jgi:hypothetical protein
MSSAFTWTLHGAGHDEARSGGQHSPIPALRSFLPYPPQTDAGEVGSVRRRAGTSAARTLNDEANACRARTGFTAFSSADGGPGTGADRRGIRDPRSAVVMFRVGRCREAQSRSASPTGERRGAGDDQDSRGGTAQGISRRRSARTRLRERSASATC